MVITGQYNVFACLYDTNHNLVKEIKLKEDTLRPSYIVDDGKLYVFVQNATVNAFGPLQPFKEVTGVLFNGAHVAESDEHNVDDENQR